MKRIFTITALGIALTAVSATAAIINPYFTSGSFGTALASGDSNGTYGTTVTEAFNGSVSVFTNISLTGGVQGPFTRGVVVDHFEDQVDQSPLETTTISRTDITLRAAGANWDLTPSGAGTNVRLTLNLTGGGTQVLTYVLGGNVGTAGGAFYFGFTSDTAFDSFTLSSDNGTLNSSSAETFNYDNLTTAGVGGGAPPPSVPEPATFGLMGMALVGLGIARRRFTR